MGSRRAPAIARRDRDRHQSTGARTPAQAAKLAKELARLIDALEIEDVDAARLSDAGAGGVFASIGRARWQFLQIVTEFWPAHLAEHNLVSAVRAASATDAGRGGAAAGRAACGRP